MEMPECPVCLQTYDDQEVIPRVLSCGHSACSPCIAQLVAAANSSSGHSFPDTIRCPACNQVVPYPRDRGPDALPKNIDLLRLCLPPSRSSPSSSRRIESRSGQREPAVFLQFPWDDELFSTWKDWIVPHDAVSVAVGEDMAAETVAATLVRTSSCGRFEERHDVSLVAVAASSSSVSATAECASQFKWSYTGRVLGALSELSEKERVELGLIIGTSLRLRHGLCRVFGLWMSSLESSLSLVCERFKSGLSRALDGTEERETTHVCAPEVFSFSKLCIELCECLITLHSQGMFCGCLALSCFCFDGYGHCLLNLNEVLLVGRRVRKDIAEARRRNHHRSSNKNGTFVSPELLKALHSVHTVSGSQNGIDYGSDVWSFACILILLLLGDGQVNTDWSEDLTGDNCFELDFDAYDIWKKKVVSTLEASLLGTQLESFPSILDSCLDYDPLTRPGVKEIWKFIMSVFSKPCFIPIDIEIPAPRMDISCCLVLGDLSCLPKSRNQVLGAKRLQDQSTFSSTEGGETGVGLFHQQADLDCEDSPDAGLKFVSLQGHHDSITGLSIGGGFLFSCSFDKTICVWSLEDFSLVQTLRGHEHRIMAILTVDAKKLLCITGDSGGCICAWNVDSFNGKVPVKKWYDHTDWRYSGVYSLAVSGSQYLYSGSGDKTIKAWSLQDFSLIFTMSGHKSVVSSLLASDGILYSGSWDGTIRLWWLHDHSPLVVLGDNELLKRSSVLSLSLCNQVLVASFDNGYLKMWRNDVLVKSVQIQDGAIFALDTDGKRLFIGGWDKIIHVQEFIENEYLVELRSVGSFSCDSVLTSLLHWQGRLFAGSYKDIKVYYGRGVCDRSVAVTS